MSVTSSVCLMPTGVQALHASALLQRAGKREGFSFADLVFASIAPKPVIYESAVALNALLAQPQQELQQSSSMALAVLDFESVRQLNSLFASADDAAVSATEAAPARAQIFAGMLAVTRQGHVRKGKKRFAGVAIKSVRKPKRVVAQVKKKKAPKRRHVWLSNQTRVVRPVLPTNVVAITRNLKTVARGASQKTLVRPMRQAA